MNNMQTLPGVFPLHEDRDFISESEWVIFKLLCRPIESFVDDSAEALSAATGHQVTAKRCDELIRIVRIHSLSGLGSWISRLFAEAGLSDEDVRLLSAEEVTGRVNAKAGYNLCNEATTRALTALQLQWKGEMVDGQINE